MSNEYAPTPPPPPPVFSINPTSPYTWVKPASSNAVRIPARKSDMERERERQRDYKLVVRSAMVNNLVVKTFLCGLMQVPQFAYYYRQRLLPLLTRKTGVLAPSRGKHVIASNFAEDY